MLQNLFLINLTPFTHRNFSKSQKQPLRSYLKTIFENSFLFFKTKKKKNRKTQLTIKNCFLFSLLKN